MKDKAKAYAALLLSTGMAYEITPETIAYRAFIDGHEAGEASMVHLIRELGRNRAALAMPNQRHGSTGGAIEALLSSDLLASVFTIASPSKILCETRLTRYGTAVP